MSYHSVHYSVPCCCREELAARLKKLQSKLLTGATTLQVSFPASHHLPHSGGLVWPIWTTSPRQLQHADL